MHQRLEKIKSALLNGTTVDKAHEMGEELLQICEQAKDPRVTIEAAKYVLWFAGDKDAAAEHLMRVTKENMRERPMVALKAAFTMIDIGENSQERIDESCKMLRSIAEEHMHNRPKTMITVAKRIASDSDDVESVLAAEDIIDRLTPVKKILEGKHRIAVDRCR